MIKSDKWIRRMAETTRMIEPFEPGQVKHHGGERLISYGTSIQIVKSHGTPSRTSVDDTPSTTTGTPVGTVCHSAPTFL